MNTEPESRHRDWQTNIILTAGVMATILLALIMAQLDTLQVRATKQQPGLPIINIQATAVAIGQIIPLEQNTNSQSPVVVPVAEPLSPVTDDLNPRPAFITGVSEEGVIYTVCGAVPEGWLLYTVRPGDTLDSLAEATQSTVADLTTANCLNTGQLSGGMQILVPQQPLLTLCGPPSWWVRYQVQVGDTLTGLAVLRRTTIDEILRANCREELDLQIGQSIFLPPGAPSGGGISVPQPSLTPLPIQTPAPTSVPLPIATSPNPPGPPSSTPVVIPPTPTIVPPAPQPTSAPPTLVRPTALPPTQPPPPPTNTPAPPPTNTPAPPPTNTPVPPPTNTPVPPPTDTPMPPPTDTPAPPPTDIPEPPPDEGG